MFYLVNKEEKITSYQLVKRYQKLLNVKKIGHGGTLDPFATGLMILATNDFTKLLSFILKTTKEYTGIIQLGIQTNTNDCDGKIIAKKKVIIDENKIKAIIKEKFIGRQQQVPPKYSALKINGKRAYEKAREGEEFQLRSRIIEIFKFDIKYDKNLKQIKFKIKVSSGTYIRKIAHDLGLALNTYGFLLSLKRTMVGDVKLEQNQGFKEIKVEDVIPFKVVPVLTKQARQISLGQRVLLKESDDLVLAKYNNKYLAILKRVDNEEYKVLRGIEKFN